MNFTRSICAVLTACTLAFAAPATMANGPEKEVTINEENFAKLSEAEQQRVLAIKDRLEVIHATDRSDLSKGERKELRTELKQLNKEVKEINRQGPVIYISATLILVIILLILLLR